MSDEIANQDIWKAVETLKVQRRPWKSLKERKKLLEVISILWLVYLQVQTFEKFKSNDNSMNMANRFDISDVIKTINEIIATLKMDGKRKNI